MLLALFAARTTTLLVRAGAKSETLGLRIAAVCAGLGIFIVGLRASRADGLHTTAAISDGFVFVVATIFGSLRIRERFARLPTVGIPLAAVLIIARAGVGISLAFLIGLSLALTNALPAVLPPIPIPLPR